jgi:hypothetical protein
MKRVAIAVAASAILMSIAMNAMAGSLDYTVTKKTFGCQSKELFDKINGYDDDVAFHKALTMGLSNGNCDIFQIGETLGFVDGGFTDGLNGRVKVRRRGDVEEYWISLSMVKHD